VSFTLLIVGSAIILFGVVIPERLGMALEFCVALNGGHVTGLRQDYGVASE
jgi:hypothetical protein